MDSALEQGHHGPVSTWVGAGRDLFGRRRATTTSRTTGIFDKVARPGVPIPMRRGDEAHWGPDVERKATAPESREGQG
jgi:hypothetical protein